MPEVAKIHILPDDTIVEIGGDQTLREALLGADVPLSNACGGNCKCTTCRVLVLEGLEFCSPRTPAEQGIADRMAFTPQIRLACQTRTAGDLQLRRLVLDDEDLELAGLFLENPTPEHAGTEKQVFILFADIRGFTAFTESLLPYDVIHLLNRYFHLMGDIIQRHGGVIDNYMGDGFMALFEFVDPRETGLRAVRAGLEMIETVRTQIGPYLERLWDKSFRIGIGLHYGVVVAGTLGATDNRRNTVIGDAVNFASRIERANKKAGTEFLMSEDAYRLVAEETKVNRTFLVPIAGKKGEHRLYEIVGIA
jgi:adenylate cyclase